MNTFTLEKAIDEVCQGKVVVGPTIDGGLYLIGLSSHQVCIARDLPFGHPTLADELLSRGYHLVSGGSDNHLMLIDLRTNHPDLTGQQAADWLEKANIVVNKNAIPFDDRPPVLASGIRLGTAAITTRGLAPDQTRQLAGWIGGADRATT